MSESKDKEQNQIKAMVDHTRLQQEHMIRQWAGIGGLSQDQLVGHKEPQSWVAYTARGLF